MDQIDDIIVKELEEFLGDLRSRLKNQFQSESKFEIETRIDDILETAAQDWEWSYDLTIK